MEEVRNDHPCATCKWHGVPDNQGVAYCPRLGASIYVGSVGCGWHSDFIF